MTQPAGVMRVAYVSTTNTGAHMTLATPEGVIRFRRIDPHGVLMEIGGQTYSVTKDALPFAGRFFLAAALMLGVDINAGWGGEQSGGEPR